MLERLALSRGLILMLSYSCTVVHGAAMVQRLSGEAPLMNFRG